MICIWGRFKAVDNKAEFREVETVVLPRGSRRMETSAVEGVLKILVIEQLQDDEKDSSPIPIYI
jgi:hypothetical protein